MHRIPVLFSCVSSTIGGLVLGALILAMGLSPTLVHAQQDQQMVDRIVAVVGDDIVLKSEVDQLVRRQTQRQGVSFSSDLWMKSLQQLVDRNLLAEKGRRDTTLTISDQQVTNALNRRLKQLKRRAGGKEKLEKIYGKSILEIKESFRDDLRDQLLATRLRERRKRKIEITPSEVKQWFNGIPRDSLPRVPKTVRLSHIVQYPKPTEKAREEAKSLISAIRDSIVSDKASFAAMARKYSDDSGTAQSGGELTGVSINDLVPEFAAVVTQTPTGKVSQVFYNDSQNGYHILRVNSKSGNTLDLNHILIKTPPSEERAVEYLSAVRDTLLSDKDVSFARMARRHSEEERTASNGGQVTDPKTGTSDLVLKQLGPSWKKTIRKLESSEISKPAEVKLLNGKQAYHIVRLERRIPAHRVNQETDYERIRKFALRDKRNRKMQEWLDRLRNEIYVDIRVSKSDLAAMRPR